jgi:hypothetical protein
MSDSAQLLVKTGRFLDGELDFAALVEWVQDREEYWAALPSQTIARALVDTIMLAAYELNAGDRDEDSVRQLVSDATLQPSRNQ